MIKLDEFFVNGWYCKKLNCWYISKDLNRSFEDSELSLKILVSSRLPSGAFMASHLPPREGDVGYDYTKGVYIVKKVFHLKELNETKYNSSTLNLLEAIFKSRGFSVKRDLANLRLKCGIELSVSLSSLKILMNIRPGNTPSWRIVEVFTLKELDDLIRFLGS